jgi:uncharacterized protein (TIGR04255 family)
MDDISFEKAPVIELIAELRWNPPGGAPAAAGHVMVALGTDADEFFLRFSNEVAKHGFTQAEKLVPAGFPPLWSQITWRFRKPGENTLLQIGPGVFSANALQPYRRWKDFRPTVELGVNAMLTARTEAIRDTPFSGVSLRYINAFTDDLLMGASPTAFISDVLGLKLTLPPAIKEIIDPDGQVSSSANLLIPIANASKVMSLAIGDGNVSGEAAAIFDVTVAERASVAGATVDAMKALDASRNIIHGCFLAITEPVQKLMQPVGE